MSQKKLLAGGNMNLFGWSIIRTKDLNKYERCYVNLLKVTDCHRWFAGWKDLDIIWKYILEDINFGGIERAREDYANARGTDEYGKLKDKKA